MGDPQSSSISRLDCSLAKTIHKWGYPHGNPHVVSCGFHRTKLGKHAWNPPQKMKEPVEILLTSSVFFGFLQFQRVARKTVGRLGNTNLGKIWNSQNHHKSLFCKNSHRLGCHFSANMLSIYTIHETQGLTEGYQHYSNQDVVTTIHQR